VVALAEVKGLHARLQQGACHAGGLGVGMRLHQPVHKVDGHKVFALIGGEGSTIAYLDIPPGLDPEPFLSRRIGVRGQAHFSEDLGTRLITVRDLESLEARK
jgi:hypothetical protein